MSTFSVDCFCLSPVLSSELHRAETVNFVHHAIPHTEHCA